MSDDFRLPPVLRSLILTVALALVRVSGAAAIEAVAPLPVLGVDPLPQGTVVEHHADAISHWVEHKVVGAVLLHFDSNDALGSVEPGNLAALKVLRDRGDVGALLQAGRAGKSGLFGEGNFIRAAAGLGVIREVVWVMPFAFLGEEDAGERLKSYIARDGFSAADIGSFRPTNGCYRGTVDDLPVTICGQERLPRLDAPVLLSFGVNFVTRAANHRGITPLAEIQILFEALRAARYPIRDTVVAYSVQTGYLWFEFRWVGEAVVDVLRNPALALGGEPPERWRVLQTLSTLRAQGQPMEGQLLDIALTLLEKYPHDPALLLFAAEASARHGGGEAALKYAEQACSVDAGYCVGLRDMGLQFMMRGNYELGGRFFAVEERLLPGMEYGEFHKGRALLWAGRPAEALKAFEAVGSRDGAFPSGFVIGAIHAARGDRAAARRAFDSAFAVVEKSSDLSVVELEVAQAIQKAVVFYREEGLVRQADVLEADPRLRLQSPEAGPR